MGTVAECLPNALYRVALPNGHVLLAHLDHSLKNGANRFLPGDKVPLQVAPFDLSRGRIIAGPSN